MRGLGEVHVEGRDGQVSWLVCLTSGTGLRFSRALSVRDVGVVLFFMSEGGRVRMRERESDTHTH
jgi:hypothetical protein